MKMNFKTLCLAFGLGLGMTFTGCQNKVPHTFMSYNVHNCIGMDGKTDFTRVGKVIKGVNPEIVAVQELDSVTGRNKVYVLQEIANVAGMHASFASAIDFMGGKYGIGLLSKEKPLSFYNIELPGREEKRTLLVAEFEKYVFCCVHLSLTEEDQFASVNLIKETLAKYDKPVFIGGDFNAHPDSRTIKAMNECGTVVTDMSLSTYPSVDSNECIDYIFQMNGKNKAELVKSGIIDSDEVKVASDHVPVYTTVKF